MSESHLSEVYEVFWPRLEEQLMRLPPSKSNTPKRADRELLEEVLALLHSTPISIVKESQTIASDADLDEYIITVRILLREVTNEMNLPVPGYDFSWTRNHLLLNLDADGFSTRAGFRLPLSKREARDAIKQALSLLVEIAKWPSYDE